MPIITLAFASASFVGCNNNGVKPKPTPEEMADYISDRTFSLMAFSVITDSQDREHYGSFCYGTGWIIDHATPSVKDYKYHVATNWHVVNGFHDLATQEYPGYEYKETVYCYSDVSCATSDDDILNSLNEYVWLNSTGYHEEEDESTFKYESDKGIDLYEIDIDFNDIDQNEKSPIKTMPQGIKDKLDDLNGLHSINNFVYSDGPDIIEKKKYIGGYPMKQKSEMWFGGRWETHEVNSGLKYVEKEKSQHSVGSSNVTDISPQYESNYSVGDQWMTGGASGSMLITEDLEICGIYWGGWATEEDFYPAFSLFKTNEKNFLDKYIN